MCRVDNVEIVAPSAGMPPTAVLRVRDGGLADSGSWIYAWWRTRDLRVIYVGSTGLPPCVRTWLHLNDPDPAIGRVAALYPAAATEPLDVLFLQLSPSAPRQAAKLALIHELQIHTMLADDYFGDLPPAAAPHHFDAMFAQELARFIELLAGHPRDEA
jgi:hypothetical protein